MIKRNSQSRRTPERILVVLPNWLGDAVMAGPALRALRGGFGQAHIVYLGRGGPLEVLADSGWSDECIEMTRGRGLKRSRELVRLVKKLRHENFDWAVIMPNSFGSALTVAMAKIARRIGYDRDGRGVLLTDCLLAAKENGRFVAGPMIRYYLALADYLGVRELSTHMELFANKADEEAVEKMLGEWGVDSGRPLVVVHPGGGFGLSKRWEAEKFAEVGDALIERFSAEVIITGTAVERDVAQKVLGAMKGKAVNAAEGNISVGQLKGLIRRSSLWIGNDTGPRHIAVAFSVPTVVIFGSTDPAWTDTFFDGERVVRAEVGCGPCQKKVCREKTHRCMELVTAEMVLTEATDLLENWGKSERVS